MQIANHRIVVKGLSMFTNSLFGGRRCGIVGAFSMGTGAFGAGLFGMNMECAQFFGPESEGLFWPVTATLSGAPACCAT